MFLHNTAAIQLEPIPPSDGSLHGNIEKRALRSALELQNAETFLWGSSTGKLRK